MPTPATRRPSSRPAARTCAFFAALALASTAAWAPLSSTSAVQRRRDVPPRARSNTPDASDAPGQHTLTLAHGGITRRALVHVPRQFRRDSPIPVVIAMHGGGGSMTFQANDEHYGLVSKAESAGFLAVFPNGISRLPSGLLATWNAGRCCGRARDQNIDDVGFIRALLDRIERQWPVDRARVFATGMSNGGMMAYRLACDMPERIAGIMAVAGTDGTSSCAPRTAVAVLHVHARNDDHVLYAGGAGPAARDADQITNFTSVPATIDKWVRLNAASPTPRRVRDVPGAWCDLYAAGPRGAPVQLCVTETGGHSWPGGGGRRGKETPSTAIDATDVMWEFFSTLDRANRARP